MALAARSTVYRRGDDLANNVIQFDYGLTNVNKLVACVTIRCRINPHQHAKTAHGEKAIAGTFYPQKPQQKPEPPRPDTGGPSPTERLEEKVSNEEWTSPDKSLIERGSYPTSNG